MLILIHIVLALSSLGLATYNLIRPTLGRLKTSYGLAGATLGSGALLVVINHASVLRTCMTGLVFFASVTALNSVSSYLLARADKA